MILVAYFSVISLRYALFLVTGQMPQFIINRNRLAGLWCIVVLHWLNIGQLKKTSCVPQVEVQIVLSLQSICQLTV